MRKHVALVLCVGAVAINAFLRYRGIESWYWSTENIAATWLFSGIWLAKFSLKRTHSELVQDEMSGHNRAPVLARLLINGAMFLTAVAIVLSVTT